MRRRRAFPLRTFPRGYFACKQCLIPLFPCDCGVFPFGQVFDNALSIEMETGYFYCGSCHVYLGYLDNEYNVPVTKVTYFDYLA